MFKNLTMAAFLISMPVTNAAAACYGSGSFQSCNDRAGNHYSVNRFGNMTMMRGSNPRTGSRWTQNSQTFGNMTFHNGNANNRPWRMTEQHFGPISTYNGTNAAGKPFHYTCNQFGGCTGGR